MSSHYRHWGKALLRGSLGAMLLCCAAVAGAQSSSRDAPELLGQNFDFDVPAQKVSTAILDIAKQAQIQALMAGNVLDAYQAEGLNERLSLAEALDRVLSGTPYAYQQTGRNAIMVGTPEALQEQSAVAGQNTIGQRRHGIEEIIVTGQKREERIQDVPIAISAFSPEDLEAQKIEGGFDLLKAVPNVTFSKTNFTGYNFQIRGIGTQAVSATTDPGVAVSFNNTTLIVNRLFEQEYLDVERVEVLRGPQGTLYGRNATAGVINVITNKPELGVWDGMLDLEVGNYNTRRIRGMFNMPLGDEIAIRGAYASTERDGYGTNLAADEHDVSRDIDGRDLWTGRLSLGWQPNDRFRANFIWERFRENDNRVRSAKQLCHRDESPEFVGDLEVGTLFDNQPLFIGTQSVWRNGGLFSQGCEPGSLYSDDAYRAPNGASMQAVFGAAITSVIGGLNGPGSGGELGMGFGQAGTGNCPDEERTVVISLINICNPDPYGGDDSRQSMDLRTSYQPIDPEYRAEADIYSLSFDLAFGDALTLTSETVYVEDEYFSTQDFTRFETTDNLFGDTAAACDSFNAALVPGFPCNPGAFQNGFYVDIAPGGRLNDPQFGPSNSMIIQDVSRSESTQFNQEVRLVSDFSGAWNFSLGFNYTNFEATNDYFVFSNLFTGIARTPYFRGRVGVCNQLNKGCIYIDPRPFEEVANDPNPEGHNYFLSRNPYELDSSAVFGESYWQATPTFKITAGLRFTWDRKAFTPIPSQLLLYDYREPQPFGGFQSAVEPGDGPEACTDSLSCRSAGNAPGGRGFVADPDIVQEWREPTGRLGFDWQPTLTFTDETMVYGFFTRGYKAGGANPPSIAPPAGIYVAEATQAVTSPTFDAEYVNAYEIGTKNTLLDGALMLNGSAFYYDYTDYQVSKIIDRQAVNENFDADIWGLELEAVFAPTLDWQFNAAIGYLNTEIAAGETSIDVMDRAQGGDQVYRSRIENPDYDPSLRPGVDFEPGLNTPDQEFIAFDEWIVVKPWVQDSQNCIVPVAVVEQGVGLSGFPGHFCFGGDNNGRHQVGLFNQGSGTSDGDWVPITENAPNAGAGFEADLGGNELPNAPNFTVSLGGQYSFDLTRDWRATARLDYYWQGESYHRVYNTEYDRLKSWSNTNLSFWVNNPVSGITVEAYVKNVFDETPITGAFLNTEEVGLSTNVFTPDPRLIGVSVRKEF